MKYQLQRQVTAAVGIIVAVLTVEASGARYFDTARFRVQPYAAYDADGNHVHGHKFDHKGYNYGFGSSYGPSGSSNTRKIVSKTISGYRQLSESGQQPAPSMDRSPSYRFSPVHTGQYDPYRRYNYF